MGKINLTIYPTAGGNGKDISQLVSSIKWGGRKGSPARTISVTLLDDDGYKHARSGIDIEEGWQAIFTYDGKELFRGIFMTQGQSEKKTADFKAYDLGIYLSNNRDTFVYENMTADAIFKDVCNRFGIPIGDVAACSYIIPDLTKKKTTGWDTIEDALSLEFDNTGCRFYVISEKGKLCLRKRQDSILQWVLEVGVNVSKYKLTKSIENVKTRIKLLSDEGTVLAEAGDDALEAKIGIMQDVETPDETLNAAQLTTLVKTLLATKKVPNRKLTLSNVLGLTEVVSGVGAFIIVPHIDVSRTLYVDSDTHTFKDQAHTMTLQMSWANDVSETAPEEEKAEEEKEYNVGDVVDFFGGYHYVSSVANTPVGGMRSAGKARIAYKNPGSAHPWSLIGGAYNDLEGNCNVYGWVDEGTFS